MSIKPCAECEHYYNPDGSKRELLGIMPPEDLCRDCVEGDNIFHDDQIKWTHYKRFWHAQLDPILASLRDDVAKRFSPYSRTYHMDRAASRIYRLELRVMKTAAWTRMKAMVDLGTTTRNDPEPRVVKIRKLRDASATAGDYLEVDNDVAKWAEKNLKPTILHEMVHYYLHDNGAYRGTRAADLRKGRNGGTDAHGLLFRECCKALGLQGHVRPDQVVRCEVVDWFASSWVELGQTIHLVHIWLDPKRRSILELENGPRLGLQFKIEFRSFNRRPIRHCQRYFLSHQPENDSLE